MKKIEIKIKICHIDSHINIGIYFDKKLKFGSLIPTQLRVRMGEWNAAGDTEPLPAQQFIVARVILHPSYNPFSLINDVAILRLTVPVPLGQLPTITTACLPVSTFVGTRYDTFVRLFTLFLLNE